MSQLAIVYFKVQKPIEYNDEVSRFLDKLIAKPEPVEFDECEFVTRVNKKDGTICVLDHYPPTTGEKWGKFLNEGIEELCEKIGGEKEPNYLAAFEPKKDNSNFYHYADKFYEFVTKDLKMLAFLYLEAGKFVKNNLKGQ